MGLGELFLREKLVDQVIEVNKKDKASSKRALAELRSKEWARVFCPHESFRTAVWVRSLNVREFTVGFKKWWNFWAFSERVEKPSYLPDALRQMSLLKAVNRKFEMMWNRDVDEALVNSSVRVDVQLKAKIPEWARMNLRSSLMRENKIFIAPGSVWRTKMWTREGFTALAKSLAAKDFRVIMVGAPSERELCESIARDAGVESLAGKTSIPELIDHLQSGKVLVSNDSGAMHSAAVAGLRTVSVFGPTVLEFGYRPWQENAFVVQLDLSCRPCAAHGGRKCPIGTHACMRDLPFTQVEAAVLKQIGS